MLIGTNSQMFRYFIAVLLFGQSISWSQWKYEVQWSQVETDIIPKQTIWGPQVWGVNPPPGEGAYNDTIGSIYGAPRPRRGHSMIIVTLAQPIDQISGQFLQPGDYVIMFAGRDNEDTRYHVPNTYDVQRVRTTT